VIRVINIAWLGLGKLFRIFVSLFICNILDVWAFGNLADHTVYKITNDTISHLLIKYSNYYDPMDFYKYNSIDDDAIDHHNAKAAIRVLLSEQDRL
jgi:hypothetical protein